MVTYYDVYNGDGIWVGFYENRLEAEEEAWFYCGYVVEVTENWEFELEADYE